MRLLYFVAFFIAFSSSFGQSKKSSTKGTVVCELPPIVNRCITINDGKPLFLNYTDNSYKGFVFVEGILDTSTLVFTGKKIIAARLYSKIDSTKKLELGFGDRPKSDQSYLITILPDLNKTLKKLKFSFARHADCKTYTLYRFRVNFK